MGFFRNLFSKTVTSKELKIALEGLERSRKSRHLDLKKLSIRQNRLVDQAKLARKGRREMEVDWHWEEIKHLRTEISILRREIKKMNLEGIGLKKYIWGLERLEQENNKEGIRSLLGRIRKSRLDVKLAGHELKERDYLEELAMTLEDVGLGFEAEDYADDDPQKASFLQNIDGILNAEASGDMDRAKEKESNLKLHLEEVDDEELFEEPLEEKEPEN